MKSPIKFAFFMAAPLEAANLYFRGSSAYSEISFGPISLEKLMRYEFELLHWPGLTASAKTYLTHQPLKKKDVRS